jgi:sugar lactone lactonase YvrE
MESSSLLPLSSEVIFGEGPRWRDGKLWFSDIPGAVVKRLDPASAVVETLFAVPGEPSGLGWLPDGTLLVVSMKDQRLLRWRGGELQELADLSPWCGGRANDMVVDRYGHAFVGNMGFDYERGEAMRPTVLLRVDPDGAVAVVAEDMLCPNGMAITADGATLVVGQSGSRELVAFALAKDGSLSGRYVYATLPEGCVSDGLCLDASGAVWVASPTSHEFLYLRPGGEVLRRVSTGERYAIACMLGGEGRRTLFCLTSGSLQLSGAPAVVAGRIETLQVDTPGAGWP